jgi:hypothetical protein
VGCRTRHSGTHQGRLSSASTGRSAAIRLPLAAVLSELNWIDASLAAGTSTSMSSSKSDMLAMYKWYACGSGLRQVYVATYTFTHLVCRRRVACRVKCFATVALPGRHRTSLGFRVQNAISSSHIVFVTARLAFINHPCTKMSMKSTMARRRLWLDKWQGSGMEDLLETQACMMTASLNM